MKMINKVLATIGLVVALGTATVVTTRSNELPVIAATVPTERRVYAFLEDSWSSLDMYIYYWGGTDTPDADWNNSPKMTKTLDDYYKGLYFYDLPVDVTNVLFKSGAGNVGASDQSDDLVVADLTSGGFKVAKVGAGTDAFTKRKITLTTAPMSSSQFAWGVLAWLDSCSSSYAGGYNAYTQIKSVFYDVSVIDGNTTFDEHVGGKATGLTIDTKLAMLQANYYEDHAGGGNLNPLALPTTVDKGLIIFVGIGLLSLTGFFIFKKTRKNIA
jgi:hypothetical protein